MPNVNLTHQKVAREAAALLAEESSFLSNVNMGRQDEFGNSIQGYKVGDNVRIKIPPVPNVYQGTNFAGGGAAPDNVEQSVQLTLNNQRHVPLTFGAKEKLLEVTEYRERYLRPAMRALSSVVEAEIMASCMAGVPNVVGTVGTIPNTMKTYAQARAAMERFLAPAGDRSCLITSDANVEMIDSTKQLFHAGKEVQKGFLEGSLGRAQGADFYEHQSLPLFVNGTQASWTVSGANQTGTTLNIGGLTASNTITRGTIFTIAGVFAVHPLTGISTGVLQQFTVTADFTAAGTTGAISIFPAIQPSATVQNRTVTASPANSAACTLWGAASASMRQNLMFHRDAFTVAMAPLPVLASCEGYTAQLPNGFSVRVMTFGNGQTDTESTRIDVLFGSATVRGLHACRIAQ